jgi:hypothetical protein
MADFEVALVTNQHQVVVDSSLAGLAGVGTGVSHIVVEGVVCKRPLLLGSEHQGMGSLLQLPL